MGVRVHFNFKRGKFKHEVGCLVTLFALGREEKQGRRRDVKGKFKKKTRR